MTKSYRAKSKAVRSEARSHLEALRAARISKRRQSETPTPSETASGDPAEPSPPLTIAVSTKAVGLSRAALGSAELPEPPDHCREPFVRDSAENTDAIATIALDGAPPIEIENTPRGHAPSQPDLCSANPSSDLSRLPGIGPGLIWLFGTAGIHTLEDLAAAEPEALRTRLGLAGQLLDLDGWIAAARDG